MDEAIYALTGLPTIEIYHDREYRKMEANWEKYTEWDRMNYIMTAVNFRTFTGLRKMAYTLIGTATYNEEKLVKLRDPTGTDGYTGDWSDNDKTKWTSDALAKLGHTIADDGTFWMPYDKFFPMFQTTYIGEARDWKRDVKKTSWDRTDAGRKALSYTVVNSQTQDVVFGIAAITA